MLVPWALSNVDTIAVKTEVCEIKQKDSQGDVYLTGSRAQRTNTGEFAKKISLYAALRSIGAAGFDVSKLAVNSRGDALGVNGRPALIVNSQPSPAGILITDTVGDLGLHGALPATRTAVSKEGDCSGALRFDLTIPADSTTTVALVCPVHPGRRAVRHQWEARQ